jgi:addiction module RelB/DinJ family antitoxin
MKATTIHIKTDSDTRDAAKEVAEAFGFTLTSMVNALLKQVARTRRLTVSLDETPNDAMIAGLVACRAISDPQSQVSDRRIWPGRPVGGRDDRVADVSETSCPRSGSSSARRPGCPLR